MNKQSDNIKEINDAWLNLNIDESKIANPFAIQTEEEFTTKLTWLMTNPEYFSFICKQMRNIDLLPTQALMLREMWNRKFPMLIASRGFGKSFILSVYAILRALLMPGRKVIIVGAAFRQSKIPSMESIHYNRHTKTMEETCTE